MKSITKVAVAAMLAAGACAKPASQITSAYVSPIPYENYDCEQIAAEATRVSDRLLPLTDIQNNKATSDAIATTAAIVVFWPAAFLVRGDDQASYELARLKGEMESLKAASVSKGCNIEFREPPPPPTAEELKARQEDFRR
ncbi:hypothetical protein [Ancylobacter pratisalsi]|uniref:Lipoprotein n=1 Tax=Ancylobacter pratisalsi TaxID=1745854 RepID=A0A6P1YK81_9HYPH|nr:hypothetical protein [Ancylobacter pratisalsi]QIB32633.1 hypothetical protein G3A50_02130 [Ancylobacter pratisalsi]